MGEVSVWDEVWLMGVERYTTDPWLELTGPYFQGGGGGDSPA